MAHHGSDKPFGEMPEVLRNSLRQDSLREFLRTSTGPTGRHPEGKLTQHDEGELQYAVGVRDGKIVVEFGSPVHWFGMTPAQAQDFAELLLTKAARLGTIRPVRIKL